MARPTKEHKLRQRSFSVDPRITEHFGKDKVKQTVENALKNLQNEDSFKQKYGN